MPAKVEPAKLCKKCNSIKSIEQFRCGVSKRKTPFRRNVCRRCEIEYESHEMRLLKNAKYRAKKKKLLFNLTLDDIKIPKVCPVFGTPLVFGGGNDSPSIDRIDSAGGYTKDNIVIISLKANTYKNAATLEEMKQLVKFYDNLMSYK